MAKNGAVNIKFVLNCDGKDIKDAITNIEEFKKAIEATAATTEELNTKAINFASICAGVDQVCGVVSQLQSAMAGLSNAYAAQVEAETKLAVNMRNSMDAREEDIQSIKDLCSAQQELGVIGDEVQLAGAQELATYLSEKAALEELIPVMNDMLAQQYGLAASQENAAQIATMLGKVMDGQTGALKRYGYSFDEAQEYVLKYGTEMERAAVLADVVSGAVGGANAELAKTDVGKLKQLENTMGDWKEMAGKATQMALPYVTMAAGITTATAGIFKFVTGANAAIKAMKSWHLWTKTVTFINRTFGTSATTATAAQQQLNTSLNAGTKASLSFAAASRAVMAATIWGAVIYAAVWAIKKLCESLNQAKTSTYEYLDAQKRAQRDAEQLEQLRQQEASTMTNIRSALTMNIARLKDFNGTKKEEIKLVNEMNDAYGDTMGYFSTVADWYQALVTNSENYCRQMVIEARTRRLADQIAQKEEEIREIRYDDKGNLKRYSNVRKQERYISGYTTATSNYGTVSLPQYSYHTLPSDLDLANAAIKEKREQIADLKNQIEDAASEAANITFSVRGSATRPDLGAGGGAAMGVPKWTENAANLKEIGDNVKILQDQLQTASIEEAATINQQIALWQEKADAIRNAGIAAKRAASDASDIDITEVMGRDLKCAADFEKALDDIGKKLKYATADERPGLLDNRKQIQDRYDKFAGVAKAGDTIPAPIEQLKTQKELNDAIAYYRKLQQTQSVEEAVATQKTIDALRDKLGVYGRAIDLAKEQAEVARLMDLGKAELTVEIKEMGMGELESRIRALNAALADTKNPLTDAQRESVLGMIAAYESWRGKLVDVGGELLRGWDAVKSIKSAVEGVTDAFKGGHTILEKTIAVIDGVVMAYQAVNAIAAICQAISLALGGAKAGEAASFATASVVEGEAAKVEAAAFTQLAAAKLFASQALLGPAGALAAGAQVAAMTAAIKAAGAVTAFADGGIISGPTLALMGEYPSARRDPEVVAPLSKLRGMLDEGGGGMPKVITLRAKGGDLMATLNYQRNKLNRIG